jgi:hypothetical protein
MFEIKTFIDDGENNVEKKVISVFKSSNNNIKNFEIFSNGSVFMNGYFFIVKLFYFFNLFFFVLCVDVLFLSTI